MVGAIRSQADFSSENSEGLRGRYRRRGQTIRASFQARFVPTADRLRRAMSRKSTSRRWLAVPHFRRFAKPGPLSPVEPAIVRSRIRRIRATHS